MKVVCQGKWMAPAAKIAFDDDASYILYTIGVRCARSVSDIVDKTGHTRTDILRWISMLSDEGFVRLSGELVYLNEEGKLLLEILGCEPSMLPSVPEVVIEKAIPTSDSAINDLLGISIHFENARNTSFKLKETHFPDAASLGRVHDCDVCLSAGSVNKWGFCEICGEEFESCDIMGGQS